MLQTCHSVTMETSSSGSTFWRKPAAELLEGPSAPRADACSSRAWCKTDIGCVCLSAVTSHAEPEMVFWKGSKPDALTDLLICAHKLLHHALGSWISSHVALHQLIDVLLAVRSCHSLNNSLHCHRIPTKLLHKSLSQPCLVLASHGPKRARLAGRSRNRSTAD